MGNPVSAVRRGLAWSGWAALAFAAAFGGCKRSAVIAGADGGPDAGDDAAVPVVAAVEGDAAAPAIASDTPMLGILAFVATVYKEPRDTSRKLGYLRVGALAARSAEPVGKVGCPGGWYEIKPRGFVCAGEEATTDLSDPLLAAASRRPNLKTALPYKYAFVRAVLPMYVRVPTAKEQLTAEFKLQEHLDWYKQNEADVSRVTLGANDVPIDPRGVPLADKKLGETGLGKNSQEIGLGALLGGDSDGDPPPLWLAEGKRAIPNVSDYKIKGFELFADRARRHTGLALVGSFSTGPESLNRRFAVTTDLRLAPASKIKPDTGSPWHGVELSDALTLPLAFIRAQGARSYKIVHGKLVPGDSLQHRSVWGLTGKMRTIEGVKYYRTIDKNWLSQLDTGLAVAPSTFPEDAAQGKKWLEISIANQTLVLWEGKRPVYATLVSSGQAGLEDPKKSTATVRGTFKIRNKHISAMMDSNESSAVGGRANTTANASVSAPDAEDDPKPAKAVAVADKPRPKAPAKDAKAPTKDAKAPAKDAKATKGDKPKGDKAKDAKATKGDKAKADKPAKGIKAKPAAPETTADPPRRGDGVYGVTKRRGEGTFQLRDVPYIQYFESGYALHAAYWHDVFGTPRSHGCVNVSPVDAHRIFLWTDPPVPEGWHGVNVGEDAGEGTTIIIHE